MYIFVIVVDGCIITIHKVFSSDSRRAYIWRGDLTEGFLRYKFGGLIRGGAYFRNFTVLRNK